MNSLVSLHPEPIWEPPILRTPRLILRGLIPADAPAVYAYASNPNVSRYTLWETHQSLADAEFYVGEYATSRYYERVPEPLGIVLRAQPERGVIGSVGCFWASRPNACMELGYALGEPWWGQGIAVEACRALIDHVFRTERIERLQARLIVGNYASQRVLEKLGMLLEGTLRSALLHRGQFRDVSYYSLLRSEWRTAG